MKICYLFLTVLIILISCYITRVNYQYEERIPPIKRDLVTQSGVCPPFYLYDEDGNLIDPVHNINTDKPYSTKQTCGKCHNYDKITKGFHFQQGRDENVTDKLAERYQWVLYPGLYGGNWCSPAPLYNYLSKKENTTDTEMDMTSFTIFANGCGTCHPGGGPFEYDRTGNRYDKYMNKANYEDGGINNYDGDYYKSFWKKSGVAEADCNMCHLPEYDYKERNENLLKWNFKWMATIGSGLAKINGSIKDNEEINIQYDISKFDKDGKVSLHLVREPRVENCLNCHSKPQWKKRGASFSPLTDVHIAKGLKCVDCHPAGSMAVDTRIKGKEEHQFGKGDDPSGFVRDDLDNTMRKCTDCHIKGYMNAPIARHEWLPPFHMESLSCQTCHIPVRKVKSALVQVSDVLNPGPKITPPPKYVWTFYDQDMNYWNHYGELAQFTAKDQPTDLFYPQYARYKGQIFPVNPVHSAWPGIYTKGKNGLHQPRMKDVYEMWVTHQKDPNAYPELAKIKDDNNDGIPEVNRDEEIDAIIKSVTDMLTSKGYDLAHKKVVWVNDDRMYFNSSEFQWINKDLYESSPYASVYKYNHDVSPALSALGRKGCVECHSFSSQSMLFRNIVKYPFGKDGKPVYEPQYIRLGLSRWMVTLSAFREQILKPIEYQLVFLLFLFTLVWLLHKLSSSHNEFALTSLQISLVYLLILVGVFILIIKPDIAFWVIPERLWFDKNHFYVTAFPVFVSLFFLITQHRDAHSKILSWITGLFLVIAIISGGIMASKGNQLTSLIRISYTLFDMAITALILCSITNVYKTSLKLTQK
ncbi:MAG: multiheme c-type cytochrome [Candidatus Hydrogenedens sp.]